MSQNPRWWRAHRGGFRGTITVSCSCRRRPSPGRPDVESDEKKFEIFCKQMEINLHRALTPEERASLKLSMPALGAAPLIERRENPRDDDAAEPAAAD